jgi:hypothetical protein
MKNAVCFWYHRLELIAKFSDKAVRSITIPEFTVVLQRRGETLLVYECYTSADYQPLLLDVLAFD